VAPTVRRIAEAESLLDGATAVDGVIGAAAEIAGAAAAAVAPIDDLRATAEYRTDQISVVVRRALAALAAGTHGAAFPATPPMIGGPAAPATGATGEWDVGSTLETTVDGIAVSAPWHPMTLLHWLREEADVVTTKQGCAEGECGACTVRLDGTSVLSCLMPAARAAGSEITTAVGVGSQGALAPIQQAFVDAAAVQCGFCIPGFIVASDSLRTEFAIPSDEQIKQGLAGNLCRCTGYYKIEEAVQA